VEESFGVELTWEIARVVAATAAARTAWRSTPRDSVHQRTTA